MGEGQEKTRIKIDKESFTVQATSMTGRQLREVPDPDIGADRDLYLEVPGPGDDRLITDGDSVDLKDGMHFFTAPSSINPGMDASGH